MRARARGIVVVAAVLAAVAACGRKGPERPGREVVTPLLQVEADDLKRSGEKLDPVLRVKATWTIEGLDVTERSLTDFFRYNPGDVFGGKMAPVRNDCLNLAS